MALAPRPRPALPGSAAPFEVWCGTSMVILCLAAMSVRTWTTSSMALLEFSSTECDFTNGSRLMKSILRSTMSGLSAPARCTAQGPALLVDGHQLAGDGSRCRQEQPAAKFGTVDLVVQHCCQDAPAQLLGVVLERDDQHPAALEHVLAGQRLAGGERQVLRIAQRGLARATFGEQRAHEAAGEDVAEQPAARWWWLGIVASVPFADAGWRAVAGLCPLIPLFRLICQVGVRFFLAGVEAGLQRFPSSLGAVIGNSAVGGHGLDQRSLDYGATDPAAHDHAAELEGQLVQQLVAATARGRGELGDAAVQRGLCIGALADASGAAIGPRLLAAVGLLFAVILLCREAEFLDQHFGGGVEEGRDVILADIGQVLALDLARLTTVPAIWTPGILVHAEGDDLLAVCHDLDLLLAAIRCCELAHDPVEWLIGAQQDQALWRLAEPDQKISAFLEMLARQRLDRRGGIGMHNIDVDRRGGAGQDTGIRCVAVLALPGYQ